MDIIEALECELSNLRARYDFEIKHAYDLLAQYATRSPSTHLGHNLGNRAAELSELAAKIEQTSMILADVKARLEVKS